MLDDPRVMHGDASGDIITTVAQRCHEVSLYSVHNKTLGKSGVQSSAKRRASGLVNFVPAVAYHFCLQHSCNLADAF